MLTLVLVLAVIALTAAATLCGSVAFVALMLLGAYVSTRNHHQALLERAGLITAESAPGLWQRVQAASARLEVEPVDVFVRAGAHLNAYTFGLSQPKVLVLHGLLVQALDADELTFVIGHELGHVRLGHTWLNSLVGGLAGIPSPSSALALLHLAFLWWNRACEHSADRAGLLVCGRLDKAVSALVKVGTGGEAHTPAELELALRQAEAGHDDPLGHLAETLATHPRLARRVAELRAWAASPEYQRLAQSL